MSARGRAQRFTDGERGRLALVSEEDIQRAKRATGALDPYLAARPVPLDEEAAGELPPVPRS